MTGNQRWREGRDSYRPPANVAANIEHYRKGLCPDFCEMIDFLVKELKA